MPYQSDGRMLPFLPVDALALHAEPVARLVLGWSPEGHSTRQKWILGNIHRPDCRIGYGHARRLRSPGTNLIFVAP
jgi:hypothetical protein